MFDPLPQSLSAEPIRTQAHRAFVAANRNIYLRLKDPIAGLSVDPKSQFFARVNGVAQNPQFVTLIQGNQLRIFNFGWAGQTIDWLYYYGAWPPIYSPAPKTLFAGAWPVPFFEYQYAPNLELGYFGHTGIQVFVHTDRAMVAGSTVASDWVLNPGGIPRTPFSVSWSGTTITMFILGIPIGTLNAIQYTQGASLYTAADGGELQSFNFAFPFP